MFRLDSRASPACTLQAPWQGEQGNKGHWAPGEAETPSLQLGTSTFWRTRPTRLGMYTYVNTIMSVPLKEIPNTMTLCQRDTMPSHMCFESQVSFHFGRLPGDVSAVQQPRYLSETPLKQPPLEGAIHFTKPDVPQTRGLRRTRAADEALSGGTGRLPCGYHVILLRWIEVIYRTLLDTKTLICHPVLSSVILRNKLER